MARPWSAESSCFYDAFPAFITDQFVNVPYLVGVTLAGPDLGSTPVAWGDPAGATATVSNTANTDEMEMPAWEFLRWRTVR